MHLDLFLSHTPADDAFYAALASALRTAGVTVYDAPYTLSDGRLPAHTTVEVRHCPLFLALLSPAALDDAEMREACAWASVAARADQTLLLLSLQAAPLPDHALATSWPFAAAFAPIAGANVQPLPPAEAIQATLTTLLLQPDGRARKAPSASSLTGIEQLLRMVRVLGAQERYRDAATLADHAAKLAPERFDAWVLMGGVQCQLRRGRQALAAAARALALQPDHAEAWAVRAAALLACKRPTDALQAADTALRLDGANVAGWNNRARALSRLKRYDEALAAYDQALTLDPLSAPLWGNRGYTLLQINQFEEALAACERAILLNPSNPYVWGGKALVLTKLNDVARRDELREAWKRLPLCPRDWRSCGAVCRAACAWSPRASPADISSLLSSLLEASGRSCGDGLASYSFGRG